MNMLIAILIAAFCLLPRDADAVTQAEIYIYNVESPTDFPFAIVAGTLDHALFYDVANGRSFYESAAFDWIPFGDYICLAGERCVVSGDGVRFVNIDFVTLTTPTIDFWGHAASVPEPRALALMALGLGGLCWRRFTR